MQKEAPVCELQDEDNPLSPKRLLAALVVVVVIRLTRWTQSFDTSLKTFGFCFLSAGWFLGLKQRKTDQQADARPQSVAKRNKLGLTSHCGVQLWILGCLSEQRIDKLPSK